MIIFFLKSRLFIKNKKASKLILFTSLSLIIAFIYPISVKANQDFSLRLKGEVLIQVENKGEAWYVYPGNLQRYYLGRPKDAFEIMKKLGLGISNNDLKKVPIAGGIVTGDWNLRKRLSGMILLQTEGKGEAWYVYPGNLQRYYLGRPQDAFEIMKKLGLGITNNDLKKIITQEDGFKVPISVKNNIYIWGNIRDDLERLEIKNDSVGNPQTSLDEFTNLFNTKNVVYNNSATVNDEFLSEKYLIKLNKDSNLNNIIIQIPLFKLDSDETFDKIKTLCLKAKMYNIEGFLLDDFTRGHVSNEKLEKLYQLIKKTNPEVNLYVVYYYSDLEKATADVSELSEGHKKSEEIIKEINKNSDGVSFWFWDLDEEILFSDVENDLKNIFPQKKLFVGIYMHDYVNQKPLEESKFFKYFYDASFLVENKRINGLTIIASYWYNQEDHLALSKKIFNYLK